MNPFQLALGIKVKQPMDLAIPRKRSTCHEGDKEPKRWPKNMKRRKHGPSNF
jgi:hypothetical protein